MLKVHFDIHPGDGPALLLIHGYLMSRAQWLANLAELAAVCRPITVELYGHGRSPSPTGPEHYTPAALAAQFDALRAELGISKWFVCGYSLGGALALDYALRFPNRINGVAFTNSTSAFADTALRDHWRSSGATQFDALCAGGVATLERIAVHPRRATHIPQAVYDPLMEDCKLLNATGIAHITAFTTPDVSVRDRVAQLHCPVLLVNGRLEKRFQPYRDFAANGIPQLQEVQVQTGHTVNMEDAPGFNQALCEFIRQYAA